jgi:dihydroorotase
MALYAQVFDDAGALPQLEGFASRFGPAFYGLPVNKDMISLEKLSSPENEIKPILTGDGGKIVSFASPVPVLWRVAEEA